MKARSREVHRLGSYVLAAVLSAWIPLQAQRVQATTGPDRSGTNEGATGQPADINDRLDEIEKQLGAIARSVEGFSRSESDRSMIAWW